MAIFKHENTPAILFMRWCIWVSGCLNIELGNDFMMIDILLGNFGKQQH